MPNISVDGDIVVIDGKRYNASDITTFVAPKVDKQSYDVWTTYNSANRTLEIRIGDGYLASISHDGDIMISSGILKLPNGEPNSMIKGTLRKYLHGEADPRRAVTIHPFQAVGR